VKSIPEFNNKQIETASIAISWNIYQEQNFDIKGFQCIFELALNRDIIEGDIENSTESSVKNPLELTVKYDRIIAFDFSTSDF
jgi:hypothetical protein